MGNFVLAGVANLCGIVTGSIINNLGWKYLFHILVALEAAQFLLQFLFVPETSYNRAAPSSPIQTLAVEIHDGGGIDPEKNINRSLVEVEGSSQTTPQHTQASTLKKTYWQELAIFTETYSDENMLQLVLAPFAVCLNLAAMWFVILPGVFIALYVAIAYDLPQLFSVPPYNLSAQGIGYLSLGSFVGGILAAVIVALLNDPLIRWATHKNNGIYEPEYRLIPVFLGFITGAGLMAFGFVSQNGGSVYLAATMYGLTLFGIMMAIIPAAGYMLDGCLSKFDA
jgi:hypothetical protein